MKNKILITGLILITTNYYVEKYIFYLQNQYYTINKKVADDSSTSLNNYSHSKNIEARVLENNFETFIINKGAKQGVKVSQVVVGASGFIGLVIKVEENISIVQTFWKKKANLILVNGQNSYGYLRSSGYGLTIESKQSNSKFQGGDDLYIWGPNGQLIPFGKLFKYPSNLVPMENITKITTVYVLKG